MKQEIPYLNELRDQLTDAMTRVAAVLSTIAISATLGPSSARAGPPTSPALQSAFSSRAYPAPDRSRVSELSAWMNQSSTTDRDLIQFLSGDPELGRLFRESAGVGEGYTVQQHTLMAMEQLRHQMSFLPRNSVGSRIGMPLPNFMRVITALHDIGKPLAFTQGDTHLQHQFTTPLLRRTLTRLGFNASAIQLATALIDHDLIGEHLQGARTSESAVEGLRHQAQASGIGQDDFLRLQIAF